MDKIETIEEFYKRKFDWMPENIRNEIGHFNVFRLEPFVEGKPTNIPYRRRDFYKIMLVKGNSQVHFADKVVEIKKQALAFSNPQIPYKWEHLNKIREGIYCIFNQHFFHQFGQLNDVIRNQISELLHFGLKMQPSGNLEKQSINASQRISTLFLELLERQFPIEKYTSHCGVAFGFRICQPIECSRQSPEPRSEGDNPENDLPDYCRAHYAGSKNSAETQRLECI